MAKDINSPDEGPAPGSPTYRPTNQPIDQPGKIRRSRASPRDQAVTLPGPGSAKDKDDHKAPPPVPKELDWPAPPPRDSRLGRHQPIRRSGGPRTVEGRAVASRNAVTHGAYAMPPSSSQEYEQHLVQTERYFNPSGPIESHLVSQIAHEIWRLGTIDRHERCAVALIDASEPAAPLIARAVGFPHGPEHHHLISRPDDLVLRRRLSSRLDDLGLAGPGGQELLAEYWVFRNLDAITRERWVLVNARVLELLSRPALVRARQATGAALLRWHGSLMALRQPSPGGSSLPQIRQARR